MLNAYDESPCVYSLQSKRDIDVQFIQPILQAVASIGEMLAHEHANACVCAELDVLCSRS